jgi:pyruvate dehydrogenase E1 component beta subunit
MRNDKSVVVLGEDVGVNGGVFRATAGLSATFGTERVLDTPLDETTIAGLTVGMASQGMKPVAEGAVRRLHVSDGRLHRLPRRAHALSHPGRLSCPMVLRVPWGGGIRAPEHPFRSQRIDLHQRARSARGAAVVAGARLRPAAGRDPRARIR